MPNLDQLLQAIETIHAAGLDETRWPQALSSMTQLCGGAGATFEVFDKTKLRFRAFHSVGLPTAAEQPYLEYWAARNPRVAHGQRQKSGEIGCDYQILDEAAMDRDGFYSELLPAANFRYFVSTVAINSPTIFAAAAVQRTRKQGHVGKEEIETMRRLTPHLQQALDVAARLRNATHTIATLEQSLDWLDDGIAQVCHDGSVVSCNSAFMTMTSRRDGIRIEKGAIVFGVRGAQSDFSRAMASLKRLNVGHPDSASFIDFPVQRPSGAPAYIVSLRPLGAPHKSRHAQETRTIVFIRDPVTQDAAALQLLREMFGLTPAEASLARALQRGLSPLAYARDRGLSPNTVYTHLRRVKDKTGWTRTALLSRKLNELLVPARL